MGCTAIILNVWMQHKLLKKLCATTFLRAYVARTIVKAVFHHASPRCHAGLDPASYVCYLTIMVRIVSYSVYIMSNPNRTVLYVGVTSNLESRVRQHKNGESSFTSKYNCQHLLYFEDYADIHNAIAREKQLKKWKREWKEELIKNENPEMKDLAGEWYS